MKHKTRTRVLSWLLSLAMVLSLLPGMSLTVYAATLDSSSTTWSEDSTIADDMEIYGKVTVTNDITLTIPKDKKLTVYGGIDIGQNTLTVAGYGWLEVYGQGGNNVEGDGGGAGGDGGYGIKGNIIIDGAKVNVDGGTGGRGGMGFGEEEPAGKGGDGGTGIIGNVTIKAGMAAVYGGVGGNGGRGMFSAGGTGGTGGTGVDGNVSVTGDGGLAIVDGGDRGEGGDGDEKGQDGGTGKAVTGSITHIIDGTTAEESDDSWYWNSITDSKSTKRYVKVVAPFQLWVGGTRVTREIAFDIIGGGGLESIKASYDDDTKTLTLNNYNYNGNGYGNSAIYCKDQNLNIVLVGNNTVTHQPDTEKSSAGITVENGNLTISGTGTLTSTGGDNGSDSFGIKVIGTSGGKLEIADKTTVTAKAGTTTGTSCGVNYSGELTVGGELTAQGNSFALGKSNAAVAYTVQQNQAAVESGNFDGSGTTTTVINPNSTSQNSKYVHIAPAHSHIIDGTPIIFLAWNNTSSLPTDSGNYSLTQDVTLSSTWNVPTGTTKLCLNGHGIRYAGNENASVITVGENATLHLYDCDTATKHYVTLNETGRATAVSGTTSDGAIEVTGGYITGGTGATDDRYGGGVYLNGGTFTMHGGTIIGNTATRGGGVFARGNLFLSGKATIKDNTAHDKASNLYLPNGKKINVTGALDSTAKIGVVMMNPGVFTSGGIAKDYLANFTSDDADYTVKTEGDELTLALVHEHAFTYSVDGATITATCANTDGKCNLDDGNGNHKITLTIAAPTLTTYGQTGEATLEGWEAFNAATGQTATATDIRYQGRQETTYGESATAPTAPGKYTAKITVQGVTASVNYEIGKATPTVDDFTFTALNPIYDGNPKSASVMVKEGVTGMGNVTVKYYSDEARTQSVENPTNVGTYYVGVTTTGGGNYKATEAVLHGENWQFTITRAEAAAENFTFTAPDPIYDGNPKSASVMVKEGVTGMGNVTVKYYSDADYMQSVENPTNVGTYYVVVTVTEGDNYYPPMLGVSDPSWYFTIDKADPDADNFTYTAPDDLTYDGSAKAATVTVNDGVNGMGDVTVQYYSDAQRTTPATPTDAGTYYVGITVTAGTNYSAATSALYDEAWQFTISRIDPIADDFDYATPTDLTYDGSAKSATVTAKEGVNGMGDVTVKYYSDAACQNEVEPTDAGTYYVGITVAQGKNYNATDTDLRDPSWQFTISKIAPVADDFDYATPTDLTYDGNAKSVPVTAKDGVNGMGDVTVNYYSDAQRTTPATPTDAGTYYVGITVAQGKNYNATDTDLHDEGWQFTIAKADIHPTVSMKNWTEGYRTSEPVLEGNPGEGDVTFTYARQGKDDFTDKKPTSAGRYIVKATVAETANYNGGEATAQFTINADESGKLTVTSPLTSVTRVTLNGRVVSPANYIVAGGDVQFTDAFLATLKPGTYTIKVTDGTTTATATYRIAANGVAESTVLSATTGDPGVVLYGLLAVSSTLGLAWMGKKRKAA